MGMFGCASSPQTQEIKRRFEFEAPKDLVLEGVLRYLSSNRIPISEFRKDTGTIYAERSYSSSIKDYYADCPSGRTVREARLILNILVKDSESIMVHKTGITQLTINLQFQRAYTSTNIHGAVLDSKYFDCETTGDSEGEIYKNVFEYVANRTNLPTTAGVEYEQLDRKSADKPSL